MSKTEEFFKQLYTNFVKLLDEKFIELINSIDLVNNPKLMAVQDE